MEHIRRQEPLQALAFRSGKVVCRIRKVALVGSGVRTAVPDTGYDLRSTANLTSRSVEVDGP